MARNGSGTFAVLNSFVSNTTISAATMNATLADIGSEITNSLPRDGQAAMTAAFRAYAGTLSDPGISFGVDTSTGIRRSAGGTMRHVSSGADIVEISSTGLSMVAGTITDANSVVVVGMPTGVILPYGATTAPTGWVRANGSTIGNASSAAGERANADTSALFTFLWTNYADSVCPVSSGRGASAAADYAANKTITLPDLRGRSLFGLDGMGNSWSGRLGGVIGLYTTNGASGGTEMVQLSGAQSGQKAITAAPITIVDLGHSHANTGASIGATGAAFNRATGGSSESLTGGTSISYASAVTGITASLTLSESAATSAHSNMPPCFLTTFIIKL